VGERWETGCLFKSAKRKGDISQRHEQAEQSFGDMKHRGSWVSLLVVYFASQSGTLSTNRQAESNTAEGAWNNQGTESPVPVEKTAEHENTNGRDWYQTSTPLREYG